MQSQIENLFEHQVEADGLAYAVPQAWWDQFCTLNSHSKALQSVVLPKIDFRNYCDLFLYEFLQDVIQQLSHKCNYLKFSRVYLSPLPKNNIKWKIVTSQFWKRITQAHCITQGIMVNYQIQGPLNWLSQTKLQVQFILCSDTSAEAFIGFFPGYLNLVIAIRNILFSLDFIQMQESKIIYPNTVSGQTFYFSQLQHIQVRDMSDTLIMIYNLEKENNERPKNSNLDENIDNIDTSNEAVFGDLGMLTNQSWESLRNNTRTVSTGAETPSFLLAQSEYEFRVKELFQERNPEQIEAMKIYTENCIKGILIEMPENKIEEFEKKLSSLAEEIVGYRKQIKEKQAMNDQL